jgi:DNA polymerase III epsilon subunit-like protein
MTIENWPAERYLVVDLEGNGRVPPDIVEIAVGVIVEARLIGPPREWLVHPPQSITWQATRIHNITNADVATAPLFEEIKSELQDLLADHWLVAHHAETERSVLGRVLPEWQPRGIIDTLSLSRRMLPCRKSYSLASLTRDLQLEDGEASQAHAHRAGYDVTVTARLFLRLAALGALEKFHEKPLDSQPDLGLADPQGTLL